MSSSLRLTLVNNIPTHHQTPLARELHRLLGEDFNCVFLNPVDDERRAMGWDSAAGADQWLIRAWESEETGRRAEEAALNADAALLCTLWSYDPVPTWARKRLARGLVTLGFSETRSKPSLCVRRLRDGRRAVGVRGVLSRFGERRGLADERRAYSSPNCHFLSIGAAAATFERSRGNFGDRLWKYAYFVDVPDARPPTRTGDALSILYAGRLLEWKRVTDLIAAAGRPALRHVPLTIEVIGEGPEAASLRSQAAALPDPARVRFHPFMAAPEVRKVMAQTHVVFLGSTEEEGWGAVVGEGMAEGCVPVVSDKCGSGTYLVTNGETGLKYPVGDVDALADALASLATDRCLADRLGLQAWEYAKDEWSPQVAAERTVAFCSALTKGDPPPEYSSGPYSRALAGGSA